jgi:putative ABC transport system ATP-binding protein
VPEKVLQARAVERTFGSGHSAVHAVRGIDLDLSPGERVMLMGPSGSGKSTLVSMLGGLLTPSAGRVLLAGDDIYERDVHQRARLRLTRVGFIFQSFNLLSALTARENVEVPMRLAGRRPSEARRRAGELLERLGLQARLGHRPRDLSGGEKQRVAIARALANDPCVVLADEPTANLDAETGRRVAQMLCEIARDADRAVLIVSHDQRLERIVSRLVNIEDGRLKEPAASD